MLIWDSNTYYAFAEKFGGISQENPARKLVRKLVCKLARQLAQTDAQIDAQTYFGKDVHRYSDT